MRKVVLVSTGGTIASHMNKAEGSVTAMASGTELMGRLHEPLAGIEVEIDEFRNIGSFNGDLPLSFDLALRIERHLAREGVSGVVTHGTDTTEESAFLADLIVAGEKPFVFTGAQRHANEPDIDGSRNLADTIGIAASDLRGLGAVVLLDQEFHAARDMTHERIAATVVDLAG